METVPLMRLAKRYLTLALALFTLAGPRGVGLEIVIEVDDVDRAHALASLEAERHGGRIDPLRDRPWNTRDFRLVDPDGYYLRVTSGRG